MATPNDMGRNSSPRAGGYAAPAEAVPPRRSKRRPGDQLVNIHAYEWANGEHSEPGLSLSLGPRAVGPGFVFLTPAAARRLADRLHDMAEAADSYSSNATPNQKDS